MSIVMQRLQGRLRSEKGDFGDFSLHSADFSNGSLSNRLDALIEQPQKKHAIFKIFVEEDASLVLEYLALRALLRKILAASPIDEIKATRLVLEAQELAEVLVEKYKNYVNAPPRLSKSLLDKHLALYKVWLDSPVDGKKIPKKEQPTLNWQQWLNAQWLGIIGEITTDKMVPRRLYFLRERRLLLLLVPIINNFNNYSSWVLWADSYLAPCLGVWAVVFFLPRLWFNLATLYTCLFDYANMKPEEKKLDFLTRLNVQWNRLWPNITNDIPWTISGVLFFWVFIGSMQPLGIYLSVAMQFYDMVLGGIRVYFELNRLNNLTQEYKNLQHAPGNEYLQQLDECIRIEKKSLYITLVNVTALFIAICLALPAALAIHPLLPLVGSVIAILATVINFEGRSYFDRQLAALTDTNKLTLGLDDLLQKGRVSAISVTNARVNNLAPVLPKTPVVQVASLVVSVQIGMIQSAAPVTEINKTNTDTDESFTKDQTSIKSSVNKPGFMFEPLRIPEQVPETAPLRRSESCPPCINHDSNWIKATNIIKPDGLGSPTGITATFSGIIQSEVTQSPTKWRSNLEKQNSVDSFVGFFDCDSPTSRSRSLSASDIIARNLNP